MSPRTIHPELRDCFERANPNVEIRVELIAPDVSQVLRRQDQFTQAPSLVSLSPSNSLTASPRGGMILTPTPAAIATFSGVQSSYDLNLGDATGQTRYKGLSWTIDSAFSRATLKNITAKVQAVAFLGSFYPQVFECQLYTVTRTPGVRVRNVGTPQYQSVVFNQYAFNQIANPAPIAKVTAAQWGVSSTQTLNFDFSSLGLILENVPTRAVTPDQTGVLPKYLIVIRLVGVSLGGTGHYRWLTDTATSHTVSGVGTFERVFWARADENTQWAEQVFSDVPNIVINVDAYPASGQGIFLIDLGKAPSAASTGRIDFQPALPPGTNATLELSTTGSGGSWTTVKHGDIVSTKQQSYHLRTTLTSDSANRATPEVVSQGIEFRIPSDVSVESIAMLPTREIALPWPKASIPEGKIRTVRTGIRDYSDIGTLIASTSATSRLEADIYLASRHPSITRDKWFRLERMMVSNRLPSATSEEFTLLSYASRLKRKIPQKVETINSVHIVASCSTVSGATQVVVSTTAPSAALPSTSVGGNEYDGKNYYMRVRSTTATDIPPGFLQTIAGSTDTTKLDFVPLLPQNLVAGDVIEVHSGIFQTQAVSWNDYDPADVWWEVLTNLLAIPTERIGLGSLPRGGRPPRVTDIAPGDTTTQNKRKITGRLAEEIEGDKVLDILSAIMGGVTLEIDGNIVFVQIIPLTDINGQVTVPVPFLDPRNIFDARDFAQAPQTPPGIEARATVVTAKYGVPQTAANPDAFPSKATTAVDPDALLWLDQQDLTEYGTADVPDEIAKWLYNSTDEGLYLASVLGAQLVRAVSTGLRVFVLSMTEKHPSLVPGDVIVINIDSYTDYDPATQTQIKGPISVRGVLVRVGNEGKQLSMFVPGLRDNVQLVQGGNPGTLPGLGAVPAPPVLSASLDATGQLIINSAGDDATASQKIAWSSAGLPSAATVRAATPINSQIITGLATGSTYTPGTTIFIAAFAYSANGLESQPLSAIKLGTSTGLLYLFTRARVVSVTPTTVVVRVAVADPIPQGANSVSIAWQEANVGAGTSPGTPQTVTPAATITEAAGTYVDFTVTRPAFGTGSGRVTFTSTAAGRVADSDSVDVPEVGRDTVFLATRARVTATTPTTVTVRVAVADPYPQGAASVTLTYQDLGSGGVTPASGSTLTPASTLTEAAGTYVDHVITRPAFGAGAGRVTFTATAANRTSDSDAVDVPEADRDTVALAMRARVTATSATDITVRVAVADPYPQGSNSVTIAYQDQGSGGVTPSSGQTVTPASTLTEAAGTYVDFTITKPAVGAGAGRVTFTATASGRISDSDAVDLPEKGFGTVSITALSGLASNAGATGPPWNRLVVSWSVSGMPAGVTYDVSYNNSVSGGSGSTSGLTASPATFNSVTFASTPGRGVMTVTAYTAEGVAIVTKTVSMLYQT